MEKLRTTTEILTTWFLVLFTLGLIPVALTYAQTALKHTPTVSVTGGASVTGTLSKSSGTFVIDHPLDPANKLLFHSFVESPDVKNMYDGIVTTDSSGEALVTLPDYFESLNRDYRYQVNGVTV
ncbi:hypothetical protein KDA23_05435, partial [Candidatus Saccharibacteria bacterium]|nr:hypothetical protein [Candidatus Saccharibacteria bacterium]